jgi:hypothetical protein
VPESGNVWILRECKVKLRWNVPKVLGKMWKILRIPVSKSLEMFMYDLKFQ